MFGQIKKLVASFVVSFVIVTLLTSAAVVISWFYAHGFLLTIAPIALLGWLWYQVYNRM